MLPDYPLQAFVDQGINLTDVDKNAIGLGSQGGAATGGSGTMYFDDIRLYVNELSAGQQLESGQQLASALELAFKGWLNR